MPNANTTKSPWENKEIGCLWKRAAKTSGEKYLTGVVNLKALGFDKDVQIIIFKNKTKTKDTHPDLRIYISEKKGSAPAAKPAAPVASPVPEPTQDDPLL